MRTIRALFALLVFFSLHILHNPLHAQLEDSGIVATDPGINKVNWADSRNGSTISEGPGALPGFLIDGKRTNFNTFYSQAPGEALVIDLGQVRRADTLQLRLYDGDTRSFTYRVETSVDGLNFTTLIDKSSGEYRGIQRDTFQPIDLRYLKIVGLGSSISNNVFHLIDEVILLGSLVVTPAEPQEIIIDAREDAGTTPISGKKIRLTAGLHKLEYLSGATSLWDQDTANGGLSWDTLLDIYVEADNKSYSLGFTQNSLSRYATAAEAEAAAAGRSLIVYIPFESDVYFRINDSGPSNNRGNQRYRLTQASGPNDSRIVRVRDSIVRSITWQEREVANWQSWVTTSNNNCFGCHVQTQTSVGINETRKRLPDLPYSDPLEDIFVSAYKQWQNPAGWVSPFSDGQFTVTQTSLWAWAVSTFRDEKLEELLPNLIRASDWLITTQQANGGWNADHSAPAIYSESTPSSTHTTGNIQAMMKIVEQLDDDSSEPFTTATIDAGSILLDTNEGNIHQIQVESAQEVTAVRLRITDSFHPSGNFTLSEFEAFDDVTLHTIISSDSTVSDPNQLISESHDGDKLDVTNGWGNGDEDVRSELATGAWIFQAPVTIDRIRLTQIVPDKQLKEYTLEYTTDPSPTLNSVYTPFTITSAGIAGSAAAASYIESVRKAASLYVSDSWNFALNTRVTAQTIIGLNTALPVLSGDLAEAALARIAEARELLIEAQGPDGGWSDSTSGGGASLAYQSAQVLYALLLILDGDLDDDLLSGVDYLLSSQLDDGSWVFPGLARRLASTTWVEIALPLIFDRLVQQFSRDTIVDLRAQGLLNAVELSWEPVEGATGYNIYRRSVDGAFQRIATNHQSDIATYLDSDVQVEATYIYMVRWLRDEDTDNESADSNEASGTPSGLVCGGDSPPEILSAPVVEALVGRQYRYQVEATDIDENDVLTYSLPAAPVGMKIDPSSGLIEWIPASNQLGSHFVRVWVEDKIGRFATQAYRITASRVFVNLPPEFQSDPVTQAIQGYQYIYEAKAVDPNIGDVLTYTLKDSPEDMRINETTGRIRWIPPIEDTDLSLGVTVEVEDANNLMDSQSYQIKVVSNQEPTIDSSPVDTGLKGISYFYDVMASDPEKGRLIYELAGAPEGMRINRASGQITWRAQDVIVGSYPLTVTVTDNGGLSDSQQYTLVIPENSPPEFQSTPLTTGIVGFQYRYDSDAIDLESPLLTYRKVSGPSTLDIDRDTGLVTWTPTEAGTVDVVIAAFDDDEQKDEQSYTITVSAPGTNTPPINIGDPTTDFPPGSPEGAVLSPRPFSKIEERKFVLIEVTDPDDTDDVEVNWEVELRKEGADEGVVLGSGTGSVMNEIVGQIDPSLLSQDMYRIWLHMTYGPTTYSKWYPYEITSRLELGVYQTSVTDFEIPLAGVPISIIRDYKSSDLGNYQFGYGWRLRYPGRVIDNAQENPLQPYTGGTRVFVTLPDGERVGFTFRPYAQSFLFPFLQVPYFEPDPGVTAKLEVDNTAVTPSGGFYYEFLGGPYNPAKFYLTTQDRIRYTIIENQGITEIRDANLNTLTFNDSGIHHSSGESIQVERNPAGNITKLTTANGRTIDYRYDNKGDLIEVEDFDGDIWKYTYSNHLLKKIIDPSGVTLVENFYDELGRLTRQLDAFGKEMRVVVSLDEDQNTQAITDRRGHTTTYTYDDQGNLTEVVNALGEKTSLTYDENFNVTSTVDENGHRTSWSYDSSNRITSQVDEVGREIQITYNNLSLPTTITYPDGSTYTRSYDNNGNLLSVTDASGRTTTSTVDSEGKILSLTDPLGASSSMTYDGSGRLESTRNAEGLEQLFTYDERGNVISLLVRRTDNDGTVHDMLTRYAYDDEDRIISKTDATGATIKVTWDNFNKPTRFIDARGYEFLFEYDKAGNLLKIIYPDSSYKEYEYDEEFNRTKYRDRRGFETLHEFDALGRKTKTTFPDGQFELYSYDAAGNQISKTDARGHTTRYRYDGVDRRVETETPRGGISRLTFDVFDNIIESTDPLGRVTTYTYDSRGDILQEILPDNGIKTNQYDLAGQLIRTTDPLGFTQTFEFDDAGRNTKVIDPLGSELAQKYDEVGNLLQTTNSLGNTTRYDYDNRGRRVREQSPTGEVQLWQYDPNGNLLIHTDAAGNTVRHEYDFNNKRIKTIDPAGGQTVMTYDEEENLTSLTDPLGNKTVFRYDNRNRLLEREDPEGKITRHEYDGVGNRTKTIDRNGRTKEFEYNSDNQKTLERWSNDSGTAREKRYEYDIAGNTLLAEDDFTKYTYTYSDTDALASVDTEGSTMLPRVRLERRYDLRGDLTSIKDEEGTEIQSSYNERGDLVTRILTDTNLGDSHFRFLFDSAGQAIGKQAFLSTDNSLPWFKKDKPVDASGRSLSHRYALPSDQSLLTQDYTYDSAGRVQELNRDGEKTTYGYDSRGQIVSANYTNFSNELFSYDLGGNRIGGSLVIGPSNKLIEDGAFRYDYDDEGNTIRRTNKSDGSYEEYEYNHDNQVEKIEIYDSSDALLKTIIYDYDIHGRRIRRAVDGTSEFYVYDGENAWSDLAASGDKTTQYLHGQQIDNILAAHKVAGRSAYLKGNSESVLGTVEETGNLESSRRYSSFGRILSQSGATDRFSYTAREYEPELNLYYYRARMYDPRSGRFLSQDPLGFEAGDANLYRYAFNAPTHFTDPTGRTVAINYSYLTAGVALTLAALVNTQPQVVYKSYGNALDLPDGVSDLSDAIERSLTQSFLIFRAKFTGPALDISKSINLILTEPATIFGLYSDAAEVTETENFEERRFEESFAPTIATLVTASAIARRRKEPCDRFNPQPLFPKPDLFKNHFPPFCNRLGKSCFLNPPTADSDTRAAWAQGRSLGGRQNRKKYCFPSQKGTSKNGEAEYCIVAVVDSKCNYHGFPEVENYKRRSRF